MKHRWQVISLIVAGTFMLAAPVTRAASVHRHDLAGRVTDARGTAIANAHIDIIDQQTGQITALLSNDAGRYLASGLNTSHRYTVKVRCIGYTSQTTKDVQVAGEVLGLDIALRPI